MGTEPTDGADLRTKRKCSTKGWALAPDQPCTAVADTYGRAPEPADTHNSLASWCSRRTAGHPLDCPGQLIQLDSVSSTQIHTPCRLVCPKVRGSARVTHRSSPSRIHVSAILVRLAPDSADTARLSRHSPDSVLTHRAAVLALLPGPCPGPLANQQETRTAAMKPLLLRGMRAFAPR